MSRRGRIAAVVALALAAGLPACSDKNQDGPEAVATDGTADLAGDKESADLDSAGDVSKTPPEIESPDDSQEATEKVETWMAIEATADENALTPPDAVDLGPDVVKRVFGRIVDAAGKPAADLFVQPCTYTTTGESCLKAFTNAEGEWGIDLVPPKQIVALHVRVVSDLFTPVSCRWDVANLPLVNNEADIGTWVVHPMPDQTVAVPADTTEEVTLAADGLEVTVKPEDWFPGVFEDTVIRVRSFPLDGQLPCFLPAGEVPDALFALTPDWLGFAAPGGLKVAFDNGKGLPAGSKVTLYVVGSLDTKIRPLEGQATVVPVGQWTELGGATVSADGKTIVSDPGSGLPGLGWIGWKAE